MSVFQIVILAVLATLALVLARSVQRGRVGVRDVAIWGSILVVAVVAVIWPDMTTAFAQAVGIQRGADFVLYCAVLFLTAGLALLYVRMRAMRREITLLTRHIALQ